MIKWKLKKKPLIVCARSLKNDVDDDDTDIMDM